MKKCTNMPPHRDGYYDKEGRWHRTKFCFMYCGPERCTCSPPFGQSIIGPTLKEGEKLTKGNHVFLLPDLPSPEKK